MVSSTSQAFISCASIVITSGMSFLLFCSPSSLICTLSRCLGEHETECPVCARSYGILREIRRNNERLADQHDVFLSEVKDGGFAAVAAGFSRGILNMSRLEDS